jgi:predicted O-methyltransferase YrrM
MSLAKAQIVAKAALKPARGRVMLKKLAKRVTDRENEVRRKENLDWIYAQCQAFGPEASALDPALWDEALDKSAELKFRAQRKLADAGIALGGGGFYPMLYFLTRLRKPAVIVETGVAAGFSSQMFLDALETNGQTGRLYSSDFPYFRLQDPERFIGLLVDDRLRQRWTLYIDGDEQSLPRILRQVGSIDLFHYDSDKSFSGRAQAIERILPRMASGGLIIMDDIQDNAFFKDFVRAREAAAECFRIYEFEGKFIGALDT